MVNVDRPLMYDKSAVRYLKEQGQHTTAIGGINWQDYLSLKKRLRIFYPELWRSYELKNWGKSNISD